METRTKREDAISMLKEDHAKIRKLLAQLEETTEGAAKTRVSLLEQIEREVKIHSRLEEEIFYPAFKEAAEDSEEEKMYFEAAEEHHVVDLVLPEMKEADPGSEVFSAKAKVLKELIEHHAQEEEDEMFKSAREVMSVEQLEELGSQIKALKQELTAQWDETDGDLEPARKARSTGR